MAGDREPPRREWFNGSGLCERDGIKAAARLEAVITTAVMYEAQRCA